jgi:hypothetical protein
MILCHIVDDYYLQGILAQMKQKEWWENNAPNKMYRDDYLMALFMHSFSWAFAIMLPTVVYEMTYRTLPSVYFIFLVLNVIVHMIIDNEKANRRTINLIQDQCLHLIQIIISWFCIVYI